MKVRYTRTVLRRTAAAVTHLKGQNPQSARGLQDDISAVVVLLHTHARSARVWRTHGPTPSPRTGG